MRLCPWLEAEGCGGAIGPGLLDADVGAEGGQGSGGGSGGRWRGRWLRVGGRRWA